MKLRAEVYCDPDVGGYFRFVFPYRDGGGRFADTETLTLDDVIEEEEA